MASVCRSTRVREGATTTYLAETVLTFRQAETGLSFRYGELRCYGYSVIILIISWAVIVVASLLRYLLWRLCFALHNIVQQKE